MRLLQIKDPKQGGIRTAYSLDEGETFYASDYTRFDPRFFELGGIDALRKARCGSPLQFSWNNVTTPIDSPGNIICVAKNYAQHAKETGSEAPKEPVFFFKHSGSLCGPNSITVVPRYHDGRLAEKLDWEAELGVVIGREAHRVSITSALDYVAGITPAIDYSERFWQKECGTQFDKGKGFATACPVGPEIITLDEVPDIQNLRLWLKVNDELMQAGNTADMVHSVAKLVSYASFTFTLQPGDLLLTGTPDGVGMGKKPPRFLKGGDTVEMGIGDYRGQRHVVRDGSDTGEQRD